METANIWWLLDMPQKDACVKLGSKAHDFSGCIKDGGDAMASLLEMFKVRPLIQSRLSSTVLCRA